MADVTAPSADRSPLAQLTTFRGRVNRAGFWAVLLAGWPVVVWANIYAVRFMESGMAAQAMAMTIAVSLPAFVVMALAAIRRLHDRDKRGHWLWLFWMAPLQLMGTSETLMWRNRQEPDAAAMALAAVAVVLFFWGVLEMGCLRGTQGSNRFGPDPRHKATA